jgi:hypothetical protein
VVAVAAAQVYMVRDQVVQVVVVKELVVVVDLVVAMVQTVVTTQVGF